MGKKYCAYCGEKTTNGYQNPTQKLNTAILTAQRQYLGQGLMMRTISIIGNDNKKREEL